MADAGGFQYVDFAARGWPGFRNNVVPVASQSGLAASGTPEPPSLALFPGHRITAGRCTLGG
jgi:hypothetical protein